MKVSSQALLVFVAFSPFAAEAGEVGGGLRSAGRSSEDDHYDYDEPTTPEEEEEVVTIEPHSLGKMSLQATKTNYSHAFEPTGTAANRPPDSVFEMPNLDDEEEWHRKLTSMIGAGADAAIAESPMSLDDYYLDMAKKNNGNSTSISTHQHERSLEFTQQDWNWINVGAFGACMVSGATVAVATGGALAPVTPLLCEAFGIIVASVFAAFSGCCRDDDAYVAISASTRAHADGNSLEITWFGTSDVDKDSLGSLSKGETDTWREDLGGSPLNAVELRVDETNDICATNFAFRVGPDVSGTGRWETISLNAAMISALTDVPLTPDCLWWGDSEGALGNFKFHWPSALACSKNFIFYDGSEYKDCLSWAVYSYDVRKNGRYTQYTYSRNPSLPSGFSNPFGSFRTRLSGNLCMDLRNYQTHNGNTVHLVQCKGNDAQMFDFDSVGRLRSKINPKKCVEAGKQGGLYDKLFIWDCDNGLHQKWTRYTDGRIKNRAYNKYIGVAYCSNRSGGQLELRHYEDGTCGTAQQWRW